MDQGGHRLGQLQMEGSFCLIGWCWLLAVVNATSMQVDTEEGGGLASLKGKHTLELETYDGPLPVLIVGARKEYRSHGPLPLG